MEAAGPNCLPGAERIPLAAMRFTIDTRTDACIGGWLAPDNPSAPASVTVVLDGRERHHVPATLGRLDVLQAGLHPSGECGFILDEERYPWYRATGPLEIYDSQSNLLLFRRDPPAPSEIRLLVVMTPATSFFDIGQHVAPAVQMIYSSAEMIGEETLNNILLLDVPSAVVVGAVSLSKYEMAIRLRSWQTAVCLVHPLRELAARLIRLGMLGVQSAGSWAALGEGGLIERFAPVDLTDPAALGRAIKRMSDEEFDALANPMVGLLLSRNKGEPIRPDQFGRALSQLADSALVGVDESFDVFLDGVDELLGRSDLPRTPPAADPKLEAVFEALNRCRPARELVMMDMVLYDEARGAVERAAEAEAEVA